LESYLISNYHLLILYNRESRVNSYGLNTSAGTNGGRHRKQENGALLEGTDTGKEKVSDRNLPKPKIINM